MKLDDAIWGALIALLGVAVVAHVRGFPAIPGQNVGPGLFPGIVGAALVACGLVLGGRALRARRPGTGAARGAWASAPEWLGQCRPRIAFVVFVAVNLFYLLAVDRLGFVVVAFVYLAALMLALRVKVGVALAASLVMTLLIHYAFYKGLKVPLPWGVLQGVAW